MRQISLGCAHFSTWMTEGALTPYKQQSSFPGNQPYNKKTLLAREALNTKGKGRNMVTRS